MRPVSAPLFTVRLATVADTAAVRRMHAESWVATYPDEGNGISRQWLERYTRSWLTPEALKVSEGIVKEAIEDPTGFYRLAEYDGQIVGFVHVSTNQDGTKELEAIYTHPDFLGRGVGPRLMDLVIDWIGNHAVTLDVVTYNERAKKFYQKYGFKEVPGTFEMYKDKIPTVQMRREAT